MKKYLFDLLNKDAYNKYCVDCNQSESTYASISYGIFLCHDCAQTHLKDLSMDISYIKPIFDELWDGYQLKVVA